MRNYHHILDTSPLLHSCSHRVPYSATTQISSATSYFSFTGKTRSETALVTATADIVGLAGAVGAIGDVATVNCSSYIDVRAMRGTVAVVAGCIQRGFGMGMVRCVGKFGLRGAERSQHRPGAVTGCIVCLNYRQDSSISATMVVNQRCKYTYIHPHQGE